MPESLKELEKYRNLLMKLHINSGHATWNNIRALLKRRGSPTWLQDMCKEMRCDTCDEMKVASHGEPAIVRSPPKLWEAVGSDVFDMTLLGRRIAGSLYLDLACKHASGTIFFDTDAEHRARPEPTAKHVNDGFSRDWLLHRPRPKFFITDPGGCYMAPEFQC